MSHRTAGPPPPRALLLLAAVLLAGCSAAAPEPVAAGGEPGAEGATAGPEGHGAGRRAQPRTDGVTGLPIVAVPSRDGAPAKGPQGAPLQLVVFTDFQCPFCKQHAQDLNRLVEHYGDRVRLVVRQFPLPMHPLAHLAAEAALAAHAEGKFWKFHDLLFSDLQAGMTEDTLTSVAVLVGLDMSRFQRALDSGFFRGIVDKDVRDGESIGVTGTPTTYINGRELSGAVGYEKLLEVCDRILEAGG